MPPKPKTIKKITKKEESKPDSDSDTVSTNSLSDLDVPKTQEPQKKEVKTEPKENWDDVEEEKEEHDEQPQEQEHRGARYSNQEDEEHSQHGKPKFNSILNFDYDTYLSLTSEVNTLTTNDLMKIAIARTFNDGQSQLCRTLRHTLRAMNGECNWPDTSGFRLPQRNGGRRGGGSGRGRNQRFGNKSNKPRYNHRDRTYE